MTQSLFTLMNERKKNRAGGVAQGKGHFILKDVFLTPFPK
jgi:hypothetical protein